MKQFGMSSQRHYRESDSSGEAEDKLNRFGEVRIRQDNCRGPDARMSVVHPSHTPLWSDEMSFGVSQEDHRGKGPRGYERSSERILEEACELLYRDSYVDATDVEVKVNGKILILSGTVKSRAEKKRAEELVELITGIEDVHNRLLITRE